MKTLLILRHAKSSWKQAGATDHDRPLNRRGKEVAPRVGRWMQAANLHPAVVLCSTAKRARKTAERVIGHGGFDLEIQLIPELYLAPPEVYLDQLRLVDDDASCALAVGHNPGTEELVELLTGVPCVMPTAALAEVELDLDSWSQLSGETPCRLKQLVTEYPD